jgi:hypothetical protein
LTAVVGEQKRSVGDGTSVSPGEKSVLDVVMTGILTRHICVLFRFVWPTFCWQVRTPFVRSSHALPSHLRASNHFAMRYDFAAGPGITD